MNSALYRGWVRHRRRTPVPHAFRYPLFMMYLDLDELASLFDGRWFWSARGPNLAWFRRADYLGDRRVPLDRAVRDLVEERTAVRPAGPIRLLTHLRYFGFAMNPVSVYYCFAPGGRPVSGTPLDSASPPPTARQPAHAIPAAAANLAQIATAGRFWWASGNPQFTRAASRCARAGGRPARRSRIASSARVRSAGRASM